MKKNWKYIEKLDEFNAFAAEPKPTPTTKPAPTETPVKFPKPSNPPQPSIDPGPKNWKEALKLCVDRFNELYAKVPKYSLKEALSDNPGIPAFRKFKSEIPPPNMMQMQALGMEAEELMYEIGEAEQAAFSDAELKDIAYSVVRKVLEGSAEERMGESFDNFRFDVEFVREGDMAGGASKTPKKKTKPERAELDTAVNKREIINALTQGFALNSQARLFDEDLDEVVDRINSDLLQNYFKFMRTALDSHKYMDLEFLKRYLEAMEEMERRNRGRNQGGAMPGGDQPGQVTPAKMWIEYEYGQPIIKVQAYCLLLAIQEMVKGVFEVISHHGLKYEDDDKKEIFARTENWLREQEGFIYGPKMASTFKEFYFEVENNLIKKGVITEHDDSMLLYVLVGLYSQDITPDQEFMDIFMRIFNRDLDKDLWPIEEVAQIYEMALSSQDADASKPEERAPEVDDSDFEWDDEDEDEDGEISSGIPDHDGSPDDDGYPEHGEKETEEVEEDEPTMDELLDKISEFGMAALTPKERELLTKYSQNNSIIREFKTFMMLRESKKYR